MRLKIMCFLASLLFSLLSLYMLSIVVKAEAYSAVTETGAETLVENYYTPTERERLTLDRYVAGWSRVYKYLPDDKFVSRITNLIVRTFDYDYNHDPAGGIAFSPYTVLTTKKFVCMGYSTLLQKFLDYRGIDNTLVHDTARNHMYNRVYINNSSTDIDLVHLDARRTMSIAYVKLQEDLKKDWGEW